MQDGPLSALRDGLRWSRQLADSCRSSSAHRQAQRLVTYSRLKVGVVGAGRSPTVPASCVTPGQNSVKDATKDILVLLIIVGAGALGCWLVAIVAG